MVKINNFIKSNILKVILFFLLASPLLDLMTSISINVLNITFNYIIIIKILFMFLLMYYLVFISNSKYKKKSIIYLVLIFIYLMCFLLITLLNKPTSFLNYEISNVIRTFYFPINLVCLFNVYDENKLNISNKTLSIVLITYVMLIFIPFVTNTGFNSYAYSKEGSTGWFNSTNEIGGIISILLPIGLYYFLRAKNVIFLVITLVVLFVLGTKVPILSLMFVLCLLFIKYIYTIFNKKQFSKIVILAILFTIALITSIIIIPKTSFYKNIIVHLEFLEVDEISDLYNTTIIDKFIFSERITYYTKTKNNFINSSLAEQAIGIGYSENYFNNPELVKMIEMDYYDVFFRHGVVGFILYFIPYILILSSIYKKTINIKKIDSEIYALYISLILIILLALFSGHILLAPSVSLIVIFVLLLLFKRIEEKI